MGLCVDMMNEFEWGRDQNQCVKPLKEYGGAAKEVIPRLRETIAALRRENEAKRLDIKSMNRDILAIEALIKDIQADENSAPALSIEDFVGRKDQP